MFKKTIESQNKKLRFSAWLQRLEDTLVSFLAYLSWTRRTFSKSSVLLAKIFSHGDLLRQGAKQKQKQINFVSHKLLEISRVFEVED